MKYVKNILSANSSKRKEKNILSANNQNNQHQRKTAFIQKEKRKKKKFRTNELLLTFRHLILIRMLTQ